MKKVLAIIICVLAIVACQEKKPETPVVQDNTEVEKLKKEISDKDNAYNDMLATMNEIMEGFRLINAAEGKVAVVKDGESADKAEIIRQNIRDISERMQQNRDLIAKLQKQARESGISTEELKKTINSLQAQLQEKDNQLKTLQAQLQQKDIRIEELDKEVANLNTDVSVLKEESASKTETINTQDKQLNTAWYVFGTKKELQGQNIYVKGKVLQSNFNKNYFTKIDIRVEKEIKLYSKSAEMLTAHPAGSYTLTQDSNNQYVLRITNPQSFWSTSKYLVVLVK